MDITELYNIQDGDTGQQVAEGLKGNFEALLTESEGKVDKEQGKGLSSNDYTDEDKQKLDNINPDSYQPAGNYATQESLSSHTGNRNNPHAVTKEQVGLGNVDNTSDADKPVSTAVQAALDGKQDTLVSGTNIKMLNGESLLGEGNITIDLSLYKVVTSLPETDIDVNKIYLVLNASGEEGDEYTEYVYIIDSWEKLGTYKATVDLTPYLKKTEAEQTYAKKADLTSYLTKTEASSTYAKKTEVDALPLPVYTDVPELTAAYTVPANATDTEMVYVIMVGDTVYDITAADGVSWADGEAPDVKANSTVVVSVVNNLAVWGTF